MKRVLTGLLLAAGTLALVFKAPGWAGMVVVVALTALALNEFFGIVAKGGMHPFVAVGHVGALLWILLPNLDRGYFATLLAIVLFGAGMLARLPLAGVLPAAGVTLAGIVYIAGPMFWGILLHGISPHWLLLVLLVIATGDILAMVVGKTLGRRKLAPRISPGKTWEGTIASAVFSTALGTLYASAFLGGDVGLAEAAALSAVVNAAGQIGDLFESTLKRAAGVKDSGTLLPGHGGVLDRIDGLLFGIPVTYGYVHLFV